MVRVISIRRRTSAGFELTKLFGIDDLSVAKDSGKVLIVIIYYDFRDDYKKSSILIGRESRLMML